ncbi:NAD-dependent protein deacetylase sirtuin-7 isoform X2 [Nerophis lumbriciformis]|uniref:NAD-dependent protein deacetylase sirtuin-7 isoform X2 n=1 Tax=Nerophis lumbriciformis TaxID=546530 RepID=UPI002ADF4F50|nr:NAD-dependent protein deacetylase sirtuin-7-like isoform X2 [Nerophis lumbriciformis]
MDNQTNLAVSSRTEKKALEKAKILQRESDREVFLLVGRILKKTEAERSEEEASVLLLHRNLVDELIKRQTRRNELKRKQEEVFDDADELKRKVRQLAVAVQQAKHLVVYTGAGISTAASIPDYRGPNGVWTQLQKGRVFSSSDLSKAEPTLTHMCIKMLYQDMLVCTHCSPVREYVRLFDVTERTSLHRHGTGRRCSHCGKELRDTIVHFGERGTLETPLNWKAAAEAAKMADVILCLGSSLKVLKKYACLWCMNRPADKRPKLYIINLQWTPKDDLAVLKIHAKCDDVMNLLMKELHIHIPVYVRVDDPIFSLATPLHPDEQHSHTRALIARHDVIDDIIDPFSDLQQPSESQQVCGGWFGRGYGKGRKKKKTA